MTKTLEHLDRNERIWLAYARGVSVASIASQHSLSERQVYNVINQVAATIPAEDREQVGKMRRAFLDEMRERVAEIMQLPPKQAYAPNGKPLPELDHSEILAAVDRGIKLDERLARLTGTDAPAVTQVSMPLVPPEEVDRVVREQAEKARLRIMRTQIEDQVRAELREEMRREASRG